MEHAAETCRVQCAFKEKDRAESVSASKLPSLHEYSGHSGDE